MKVNFSSNGISLFLQESASWRRRLLAMFLGVLAALALPPFYCFPLLIPSLSGLFLLVYSAPTGKKAFGDGWWWGLGYFAAGLYWICISLYVEPEKFAWLTPFALFGLPSVLGIYTGLVTLILYHVKAAAPSGKNPSSMNPLRLVLVFAALWVASEYLRAHLFTGFPWNLIGYAWTISDMSLQGASVIGIYGLSWLTILLATLPATFILRDDAALRANVIGAMLLLGFLVFGAWRLETHPTQYTAEHIRVVQGNIAETMHIDPKETMKGLQKYAALTRSDGLAEVQAVIWPETAIPYYVEPDSSLARDLGRLLPKNTLLIAGGLRAIGNERQWKAWNSLFVINNTGTIIAAYDKHHLVPFGEYIPLRHILPLENIAGGHGDFSTGEGPQTLHAGSLPSFSPLICYEAIFPDEAVDPRHVPDWLVNITNDAWFGFSSGPYQHLQMARTRAVEQGLPLARAANTGISAMFDPYGRMVKYIPLQTEGFFDAMLPSAHIAVFNKHPALSIIFIIIGTVFFGFLGRTDFRQKL